MNNLLKETLEILEENWKTESDVDYIIWYTNFDGEYKVYNTFEYFKKIADKIYDCWYWTNEVQLGLKIVWKDFWLERFEYDGSEWWEFKEFPKKPKNMWDIEIFDNFD